MMMAAREMVAATIAVTSRTSMVVDDSDGNATNKRRVDRMFPRRVACSGRGRGEGAQEGVAFGGGVGGRLRDAADRRAGRPGSEGDVRRGRGAERVQDGGG